MKYLIIGLGNIGGEYIGTRHNIGFEAVDHFVQTREGEHKIEKYGEVSRVKFRGRQVTLLKPNTYVNLSGKAMQYWLQKEKIPVERSLVISDDIHLSLGKMRLRVKGNSGGHNGLKSIEEVLGSNEYPRLRIGIGNDFKKGQQVDFVLGRWETEEMALLPIILERSTKVIEAFIFRGVKEAMDICGDKKIK